MNILLSIKPEYAKLIYEGKKTIEYRKDFPKYVLWRSKIFLYETAPVKRVTGYVYFNKLKKHWLDTSHDTPPHHLRGVFARGCVSWDFLKKYGRGDNVKNSALFDVAEKILPAFIWDSFLEWHKHSSWDGDNETKEIQHGIITYRFFNHYWD